MENTALKHQYSYLYIIARHKNATVTSMFSMVPLNISFRKFLLGDSLLLWHNLVTKISHMTLNENEDLFIRKKIYEDLFKWELIQNEAFHVRSMYNAMIRGNLWKICSFGR
jgi:hypothetical protein